MTTTSHNVSEYELYSAKICERQHAKSVPSFKKTIAFEV